MSCKYWDWKFTNFISGTIIRIKLLKSLCSILILFRKIEKTKVLMLHMSHAVPDKVSSDISQMEILDQMEKL